MGMKPRPVAVCSACGMLQYDAAGIGEPCNRQGAKIHCPGVYCSRLSKSDWIECPACNGSGRDPSDLCSKCGGIGWFASRQS